MKPEDAEKVLSVLDSVFKQLGVSSGYDGALKEIAEQKAQTLGLAIGRALLVTLGENAFEGRLDKMVRDGEFPTRDQLKRELLAGPELTPDDQAQMERFKKVPQLAKAALEKTSSEIRPTGGRPRIVSPADYPKICDEIAARLRNEPRVGNVIRAVAAKYNCKRWTIQKIWNDRTRLDHNS